MSIEDSLRQTVKLDQKQLLTILTTLRLTSWLEAASKAELDYDWAFDGAFGEACDLLRKVDEKIKGWEKE